MHDGHESTEWIFSIFWFRNSSKSTLLHFRPSATTSSAPLWVSFSSHRRSWCQMMTGSQTRHSLSRHLAPKEDFSHCHKCIMISTQPVSDQTLSCSLRVSFLPLGAPQSRHLVLSVRVVQTSLTDTCSLWVLAEPTSAQALLSMILTCSRGRVRLRTPAGLIHWLGCWTGAARHRANGWSTSGSNSRSWTEPR